MIKKYIVYFSRILGIIFAMTILVPNSLVFAIVPPSISLASPYVDSAQGKVIINGSISTGTNQDITVIVIKPKMGGDSNPLKTSAYTLGQKVTSGENGAFQFAFPMGKNAVTGTYKVIASGTNVNQPTIATFDYFNPQDTIDMLKVINDAKATEIMDVIRGYNDVIHLNLELYDSQYLPQAAKNNVCANLADLEIGSVNQLIIAFQNGVTLGAINAATTINIDKVVEQYNAILELPLTGDYNLLKSTGKQAVLAKLVSAAPYQLISSIKTAFNTEVLLEIKNETIAGDINADETIDVGDIVALLHILPDALSLNTKQKFACDVTKDGQINNEDVLVILKNVTKIIPNNSANVREVACTSSDPTLELTSVSGNAGQGITLSVRLDKAVNLSGMQFTVTYNPDVLILGNTPITLTSLPSGCISQVNTSVPGEIEVAVYDLNEKSVKDVAILNFFINSGIDNGKFEVKTDNIAFYSGSLSRIPTQKGTGVVTVTRQNHVPSGSGGSAANREITTPITTPTPGPTVSADPNTVTNFMDIKDVPWAEQSIIGLAARGIVTGYGDQFKPFENITREQFVKMLIEAFALTDNTAGSSFTDVDQSAWYYKYVSSAQKLNIVSGTSGQTFGIGKEISRQEMAVLVYRTASRVGIMLGGTNEELEFTDAQSIEPYAVDSIKAMKKSGLINGVGDNLFAPNDTATRAMAAKVIYELIKIK